MRSSAITTDWEKIWFPYDESLYMEVLNSIFYEDVVVDIGAGDLRLSKRIAEKCNYVYALEINSEVIRNGINKNKSHVPENLQVLNVDARYYPFPNGITTGVLLMRHCKHVKDYINKLKDVGAGRLITNARWRFWVETIYLNNPRIEYNDLIIGSFACLCGSVGFKPGDINLLFPGIENVVNEVVNCPGCQPGIVFV